jgi:hypothetical protein
MAKIWVLDTGTKGTGAEMVPLEKVLQEPVSKAGPTVLPAKESEPTAPRAPKPPARFKVVDVLTQEVLVDGADARTTIEALGRVRSVVDVHVFVWEHEAREWRRLSMRDQKRMWEYRTAVA